MSGKVIAIIARSHFRAGSASMILLVNMLQKWKEGGFTMFKTCYGKSFAIDFDNETLVTLIASEEFIHFFFSNWVNLETNVEINQEQRISNTVCWLHWHCEKVYFTWKNFQPVSWPPFCCCEYVKSFRFERTYKLCKNFQIF